MLVRYAALFRVVWFGGRYGGGKTSGALHLADRLVREHVSDKLVANFHVRLPVVGEYASFKDVSAVVRDAVVIYDESWIDLGMGVPRGVIREYLAYLRKRNLILLLPSVQLLAPEMRKVYVQRAFNALPWGVPLWVYEYEVSVGLHRRDKGKFWLWEPGRVWASYDHREIPGECFYEYRIGQQVESTVRRSGGFGASLRRLLWRSSVVSSGRKHSAGADASGIGAGDTDPGTGVGSGGDTDGQGGVCDSGSDRHASSDADSEGRVP